MPIRYISIREYLTVEPFDFFFFVSVYYLFTTAEEFHMGHTVALALAQCSEYLSTTIYLRSIGKREYRMQQRAKNKENTHQTS